MKHRIRVLGIVRKGDKIAMIQQINPHSKTMFWTLPGGGLELEDENIFKAAEREVLEEVGLSVKSGQIRFVSEHFDPKDKLVMASFWIDCFLLDEKNDSVSQKNNVEGDNINDVRWWKLSDILSEKTEKIGRMILKPEFWAGLETSPGVVTYLGKS
jgi:ADP-ribose pyrophosphatase YjhB (NUDIX family)